MSSSPTLHEALVTYRRAMAAANVPKGTRDQYGMVCQRLLRRYPARRFAGITETDLADFLYGDEGILVGRSSSTGTTYRAALNSFFAFGRERGWTKHRLTAPKPVFRQRTRRPEWSPTRLSESELIDLLERAEHPMLRGMIAVGMSTALRISDIQKIKATDVDLVTYELYVWVQKTQRFDPMPITLDLEEELQRYIVWLSKETGARIGTPDSFLFPGWSQKNQPGTGHLYYVPDTKKRVSYSWASLRLKALFAECGIIVEAREAWHVIRRSVARIYFDRLRDEISHDHALRQTSALLGHRNQETTERYLGLQAEVQARNESLRGKRFLQRDRDRTVTPLKRAR